MFRFSPILVLPTLVLSAAASLAQTGFTSKTYPASGESTLLTADFNHDGKPDIFGFNPSLGSASIYLNDGSGGFKAGVVLPPPEGSLIRAKIVDLNGDGSPDIVACDEAQSRNGTFDYLVTYLNDGSGNFTKTQVVNLANGCSSIVVGDVNLDGRQDVVIASGFDGINAVTPSNIFSTFYGDGTGKVSTTPIVVKNVNLDSTKSGSSSTSCVVDDIIGGNFYLDGQFSLVVNSQCYPVGQSSGGYFGTTFLAHGEGNGQFTFAQSNEATHTLVNGQTVDINQDGRPDALFLAENGAQYGNSNYYAINNGGGSFTYASPDGTTYSDGGPQPTTFYGEAVGDLTGDGINDLATVYATYTNSNTGFPAYIAILAGLKSGSFTESQHFQVDANAVSVSQVVTADFNGDGKIDLAVVSNDNVSTGSASTLHVYLNNASSNSACSAPSTTNTNVICTPTRGSTASSPVTVTAASNVPNLTLNRLYLDNKSVYQTTNASVNTPLTIASGTHTLVLVSYNSAGKAFSTSTTFTVGTSTPPPSGCLPSSSGVSICAPTSGSTAASPVTITAGALAQTGNITAIRAYIDNVAVFTTYNPTSSKSQQISQSVTVAPGSHKLVVVGYESTGASLSRTETFTVGGTAPCYPSSAGAQICSPAQNATTTSPVTIVAGATAGSGYITAVRVYVDNTAATLVNNPQQSKSFAINTRVTIAAGKHNIVVVGYQSTGGSVSASDSVTVQ